MVNKLPYPLMVRQHNSVRQEIILHPDEKFCYNFERAEEQSHKKIVIGDFGGGREELKETPQKLSRPFLVEDIDDFQISYPSDFWNPQWTGWNEPHKDNEFHRCVRVGVTSKDDATLFIFFQIPSIRPAISHSVEFPEYSVKNATGHETVVVNIMDTKTYFFVLSGIENCLPHRRGRRCRWCGRTTCLQGRRSTCSSEG